MDVIEERCGGADLGKADVKVCIRVPGTGRRARYEIRTFSTMNDGLLELRDWLVENRIARIGMEATASYWKPLFYLLEATEGIEPWLLNARHIKTVPGRKTDVKDCQWICKLVEHGLVRPSFVPPRDIRQLRDLTRYRTETVRDRARDVNRLAMLLEDTGIKLSSVVTDITGRSARAMLDALVAGERDAQVLASLALGSLQSKVPLLTRALTGDFNEHHAFMVASMLRAIDEADNRISCLSEEINRQLQPLRQQVDLVIAIPGISLTLAQVLIAEIGVDMSRFATAGHLASWAGVCPGKQGVSRQTAVRTHPPRRHLAQDRSVHRRRQRRPQQDDLPGCAISAAGPAPGSQARDPRRRTLHPRRRLAHPPRPRAIPRSRPRSLHQPPRQRTSDPTPDRPTRRPRHGRHHHLTRTDRVNRADAYHRR